jgi:hypothetical protein
MGYPDTEKNLDPDILWDDGSGALRTLADIRSLVGEVMLVMIVQAHSGR